MKNYTNKLEFWQRMIWEYNKSQVTCGIEESFKVNGRRYTLEMVEQLDGDIWVILQTSDKITIVDIILNMDNFYTRSKSLSLLENAINFLFE